MVKIIFIRKLINYFNNYKTISKTIFKAFKLFRKPIFGIFGNKYSNKQTIYRFFKRRCSFRANLVQ